MNNKNLLITREMAGKRLDCVLRDSDCSRATVRKAILAGQCCVDGVLQLRPDIAVKTGQRVTLRLTQTNSRLAAEQGELELLWQDEHFVVCNKPARLTVHPCPSCPEHTLAQRLLGRFPQLALLDGQRPGIVHRLDKDTSGLLLAALDENARLAMSDGWRNVKKDYLALVSGLPPVAGQCREPLGRHPTVKTKMSVPALSCGGKSAHTEWTRLWTTPDKSVSLLCVRIHTGRTHQIRVHLAHLGYPLLGDKLYAPKTVRDRAPRQMLHAWKLEFTHPYTNETMRFSCPPPYDMPACALAICERMQRVVIVGNPGSGKSTFARHLETLGLPVFSADKEVASLYARGSEAAGWLGQRMGGALLDTDGAVNKNALFAAMREDSVLRKDIETMAHAFVRVAVEAFWTQQEALGATAAVAELPLYFECCWQNLFTPAPFVANVCCPRPARFERLMSARGWNEEKAAVLESWQWPEDRKKTACDVTVDNSGGAEALETAARVLLETLKQRRLETGKTRMRELTALWQ